MNIYSLPGLISFTLNFSLAFIVLMDGPKSTLNRWFSAYIFSFSLWNLAEVIILNSHAKVTAMFWGQILYRIIFFAPAFFVIIAYHFPKNFHPWAARPLFYTAVFSVPVLILCLSFPDFQFQLISLSQAKSIYYFQLSFVKNARFILLLLISLVYILWGNWVLFNKIFKIRTIRSRNQTKFFTVGMIIVFVSFIIIQVIHPFMHGALSIYFLSTFITFLIAVFFFIAIVQFHLFRPKKYLSSGLAYTILSSFALAVYFLLIKSISDSLVHYFNIDSFTLSGLLIFVLVLMIRPFEKKLNVLFDRKLNKDIHQYRKNSLKLFRELQVYAEPTDFFKYIETFLIKNFYIDSVKAFYLADDQSSFIEASGDVQIPEMPLECYLVNTLKKRKKVLEFYELDHRALDTALHSYLEKWHTRIILPLIFNDEFLGFLLFSRKKYGLAYTEDEIEIFNIFASNIAGSFQRDNIIRQMRDHYKEYFQLEKLAALGQLTAGIAHEIRNPLSTISTSAETLLNPQISPQNQQELKQFIVEEAGRLNNILTDFLNLSHIRPAEFIELQAEELAEFLEMNLVLQDTNELQLDFKINQPQTFFISDPSILKQILINLGINSIAAIKKRVAQDPEFSLGEAKLECRFDIKPNLVHIYFSDNGIGIPEENLDTIFEPFFTTKESGTGLGLSIVQNLTDALGGKILVKSQPGKTVFHIQLPKKLDKNSYGDRK